MAKLYPQIRATIQVPAGTDLYGAMFLGAPKTIMVGVVSLVAGGERSSVRADSSASRGRSEEPTNDAKLLFDPGDKPVNEALVVVQGMTLRVVSVHPRFDLNGVVRHHEVILTRAG